MTALSSYRTGTISVAAGGTIVTGVGSIWSGSNVKPGDVLEVGNFQSLITDVTDTTHLVISPWGGGAQSGASYKIWQVSPQRFAGAQAMQTVNQLVAAFEVSGFFWFVGVGLTAPDPSYGNDGQWAYQPSTGAYWLKTGGVWVASGSPAAGYGGTSTTSRTIGAGSQAFTTQAGLAYNGARVRAAAASDVTKWMEGVATYSGTTLTITVDKTNGSGTFASWVFAVAGQPATGDVQASNNGSEFANKLTTANNLQVISFGGAQSATDAQKNQALINAGLFAAIPGYLFGMTLAATGSNAQFTTAAGVATSSDNTDNIVNPSSITKSMGAFAAGSGFGSLDTGSAANSTWYHVHAIKNPTTQAVDILTSLSAAAPTMPSGYTKRRRIGSVRTDASGFILAFTQVDDEFHWAANFVELGAAAIGSTAAATLTLAGVPSAVIVEALIHAAINPGASANGVLITSLDENDVGSLSLTGSRNASLWAPSASLFQAGDFRKRTNTSAALRWRAFAAQGDFSVYTYGYVDRRGRGV